MHKNAQPSGPPQELAAESGLGPGVAVGAPTAPPGGAGGQLSGETPAEPRGTFQTLPEAARAAGTAPVPITGPAPGGPLPGAAAASRAGRSAVPAIGAAESLQRGTAARAGVPLARATETDPGAAQQERIQRAEAILGQLRVHLTRNGLAQATLHLSPAELGRLAIRVAVRQGRVTAVVRAESPETLELLEQHLPELRAALIQSGLEPDSFEFVLGFGAEDQPPGEQSAGRHGTHPASAGNPEAIALEPDARQGAHLRALVDRLGPGDQGVDTYA